MPASKKKSSKAKPAAPATSSSVELKKEIVNLRLTLTVKRRLRLEILGAISKVFREFDVSISDDLLASIVFALPIELTDGGPSSLDSLPMDLQALLEQPSTQGFAFPTTQASKLSKKKKPAAKSSKSKKS